MFIEFTRLSPFWVILLLKRYKLFSLQLVCVSAVDKCLIPSSVMLLNPRFKLFSSQLVSFSKIPVMFWVQKVVLRLTCLCLRSAL